MWVSLKTLDRGGRVPKRKCDRGVTGEEGYNEIAQIGVT